jgi:2-polyprenyl-6-methoxyphenol hydroxylase-like FAD-dependent oxidoreductase
MSAACRAATRPLTGDVKYLRCHDITVSDLEILRGDLVDVPYRATADQEDYRFHSRIAGLEESGDGMTVTPANGSTVHADLVVGADGPHSVVRRLAFRRGAVRHPAGRLSRLVQRSGPGGARRLVPDVPYSRRAQRIHAPVT